MKRRSAEQSVSQQSIDRRSEDEAGYSSTPDSSRAPSATSSPSQNRPTSSAIQVHQKQSESGDSGVGSSRRPLPSLRPLSPLRMKLRVTATAASSLDSDDGSPDQQESAAIHQMMRALDMGVTAEDLRRRLTRSLSDSDSVIQQLRSNHDAVIVPLMISEASSTNSQQQLSDRKPLLSDVNGVPIVTATPPNVGRLLLERNNGRRQRKPKHSKTKSVPLASSSSQESRVLKKRKQLERDEELLEEAKLEKQRQASPLPLPTSKNPTSSPSSSLLASPASSSRLWTGRSPPPFRRKLFITAEPPMAPPTGVVERPEDTQVINAEERAIERSLLPQQQTDTEEEEEPSESSVFLPAAPPPSPSTSQGTSASGSSESSIWLDSEEDSTSAIEGDEEYADKADQQMATSSSSKEKLRNSSFNLGDGERHWIESHRDRFFALCFPMMNLVGILAYIYFFVGQSATIHRSFDPVVFYWDIGTPILMWIDAFLVMHAYRSTLVEGMLCACFALTYCVFCVVYWLGTGRWPYRWQTSLADHGAWLSVIVHAGFVVAAVLSYFIARTFSESYWGCRSRIRLATTRYLHTTTDQSSSSSDSTPPITP